MGDFDEVSMMIKMMMMKMMGSGSEQLSFDSSSLSSFESSLSSVQRRLYTESL
jgi:hypothetical protein